jgi:hypothetical protein
MDPFSKTLWVPSIVVVTVAVFFWLFVLCVPTREGRCATYMVECRSQPYPSFIASGGKDKNDD